MVEARGEDVVEDYLNKIEAVLRAAPGGFKHMDAYILIGVFLHKLIAELYNDPFITDEVRTHGMEAIGQMIAQVAGATVLELALKKTAESKVPTAKFKAALEEILKQSNISWN